MTTISNKTQYLSGCLTHHHLLSQQTVFYNYTLCQYTFSHQLINITQPSQQPVHIPSRQPSQQPSVRPSKQPMGRPTSQPSGQPAMHPSDQPTTQPSIQPSAKPTRPVRPSSQPSTHPSRPSGQPSQYPSRPSSQPSSFPSNPSSQPSEQPSRQPISYPTSRPTSHPSVQLTFSPISETTLQSALILPVTQVEKRSKYNIPFFLNPLQFILFSFHSHCLIYAISSVITVGDRYHIDHKFGHTCKTSKVSNCHCDVGSQYIELVCVKWKC